MCWAKVVDAIEDAAEKRRQRQAVNQAQYRVGDWVWLRRAVGRKGLAPKLQKPWTGPFEVLGTIPSAPRLCVATTDLLPDTYLLPDICTFTKVRGTF